MKIGIIGAGPRGLSAAERILRNNKNKQKLQLFLFDPVGPGGRIWRLDQPKELLMNSVSQQVTLFTDETLSSGGVVAPGPNLYQWSKGPAAEYIEQKAGKEKQLYLDEIKRLEKDQQSTRCLYSVYQHWFFSQLQKEYGESLSLIDSLVEAVDKTDDGFRLKTVQKSYTMDRLILASGHWENEATGEEQAFSEYAREHQLFYQMPANPADVALDQIPAQEPVILRGLGLSFFDYVGLFTSGRGGRFEEREGKLVYHPSGNEPVIYSGSRRGLPYYPRGRNQKQGGAMAWPKLLTKENLKKWHEAGNLTGELFFEYLKKDVELFYYKKIIEEHQLPIDIPVFEKEFLAESTVSCLDRYPGLKPYRWSWEKLSSPITDSNHDFAAASRHFIEDQIMEAEKGNCTGALTSAFDALKDWRDPIRQAMAWGIFSVQEYKDILWGWFTHLNAFLTIGPPVIRTKELAALIDAGIFHLIEPPLAIQKESGKFVIHYGNEAIKSRFLIEARIPKTDVLKTENPVIRDLSKNRLIRPFKLKDETGEYATGAIEVERGTNRVVCSSGEIQTDFYCFGIPVEGVDWLTAAAARPYTDPWNLRQADTIAQLILSDG
ncbi:MULTISPECIES: FAD/NAD(P)-binding protein [unclassified Enterococcus]|uniref:FAD/NAD(P)-binding protein n=1 Tax=unclassified Enterococcus TaxID=2608891 RepID=UPI0013EC70D6|nr:MULTISPECIES: FAD/NAD(P)-binding protein [unclassified Enterococcus]